MQNTSDFAPRSTTGVKVQHYSGAGGQGRGQPVGKKIKFRSLFGQPRAKKILKYKRTFANSNRNELTCSRVHPGFRLRCALAPITTPGIRFNRTGIKHLDQILLEEALSTITIAPVLSLDNISLSGLVKITIIND